MTELLKELAPPFQLPIINRGAQMMSLADLLGKAILLTFWVTWCPACQHELPQKEVFYRSIQNGKVTFMTVNVTGRESDPDKVSRFLEAHRLTFPVLRDEGTKTYDAYRITSVPTTVLIDPDGFIVNRYDETVPFVNVLSELAPYIQNE